MTETASAAATGFDDFFYRVTGHRRHEWQKELARDPVCRNRLIRIPTGLGKTLGVMGAWLYNRVEREDPAWPRRLVWCLPMRVLVEQTEAEARKLVDLLGCLWDGRPDTHGGKVGVHVLMGGTDAGDWHLYPEECAILIGTQDMLLSRALNRGYASPRARWPMEFGLLNNDCLWVMDEVQLMGPGLWTSGQLDWMRNDRFGTMFPCHTWWMSATNRVPVQWTFRVLRSGAPLSRQSRKLKLGKLKLESGDELPACPQDAGALPQRLQLSAFPISALLAARLNCE